MMSFMMSHSRGTGVTLDPYLIVLERRERREASAASGSTPRITPAPAR